MLNHYTCNIMTFINSKICSTPTAILRRMQLAKALVYASDSQLTKKMVGSQSICKESLRFFPFQIIALKWIKIAVPVFSKSVLRLTYLYKCG